MEPLRSVQANARLTSADGDRLDRFARRHQWSRGHAAEILIKRGLDEDERQAPAGKAAEATAEPPDTTAVTAA